MEVTDVQRVPVDPDAGREGVARDGAAHAAPAQAARGGGAGSTQAGIPTGVLVAPLMPGINDEPGAGGGGGGRVPGRRARGRSAGQALFLARGDEGRVHGLAAAERPDLVALYERLYASRSRLAPRGSGENGAAAAGADARGDHAGARSALPARAGCGGSGHGIAAPAAAGAAVAGNRRCAGALF